VHRPGPFKTPRFFSKDPTSFRAANVKGEHPSPGEIGRDERKLEKTVRGNMEGQTQTENTNTFTAGLTRSREVSEAVETEIETKEEVTQPETKEAEPVAETKESAPEKAPEVQAPKEDAPLGAVLGERKRRQAAEKRAAELEAQLKAQTPSQFDVVETVPAPNTQAITALEERVNNTLMSLSVKNARSRYQDYDDKYQAFAEAAQKHPSLYDAIETAEDPAQLCYEFGDEILFQKKYGKDRPTQLKNLEKEWADKHTKRIEAEVEKKYLDRIRAAGKQPTNISTARAAGGKTEPEYKGQTFTERIASRKR
jgi:hypothetical protein